MEQKSKQKKSLDKATAKRLFSYLLEYKFKYIIVLICIAITSTVTAIGPNIIRILIDDYITPLINNPNPSFDGIKQVISFLALVFAIGVIASFVYSRLMVNISQGVLDKIRKQTFAHLQKLPIKYFDTNAYGDIMSRFTNDTDALKQALSQSIPQAFSIVITIVSILITMIVINIYMTVFVIFYVVFQLFCAKKVLGRSGKYFGMQQKTLGELNGYIEEMINGQKVVKVFGYEEKSKEEFYKKSENLRKNAFNANSFANMLMPLMTNLGILQYVMLAIFGGFLITNDIGSVTVGSVVAFLILSRNFNAPIGQVSQQINFIIMSLAGAKRIFSILDEEVEVDDGYVSLVNVKYENGKVVETNESNLLAWKHKNKNNEVTYNELKGNVEFEDVYFGYTEEKMILKDINIKAKQGQKIALVGATGAGKTTITNLINRFYDISEGKIKYDGINIEKIQKNDLRRSLGVVLQDTNLFTGTVMENIRYGRLDATDKECIEAAKKANAHHFIELLKDGYNTIISGSGDSLSQGQKQLLSIARAIVLNPPVMILDEATSSIDTHTEAIVQKGMDMLMQDRTVFVIAHRLSTIRNADKILVIDDGKIIEEGNHNELINKKGKYYKLYTGMIEMD